MKMKTYNQPKVTETRLEPASTMMLVISVAPGSELGTGGEGDPGDAF